ncbi:S-adenosyl-L-methionine-dependent methyltransferase [Zopfochytrium polystomum]|nr:S-adenosyl-L-methionine-dependent methyltransferase [Zopfochytrium polystomum]
MFQRCRGSSTTTQHFAIGSIASCTSRESSPFPGRPPPSLRHLCSEPPLSTRCPFHFTRRFSGSSSASATSHPPPSAPASSTKANRPKSGRRQRSFRSVLRDEKHIPFRLAEILAAYAETHPEVTRFPYVDYRYAVDKESALTSETASYLQSPYEFHEVTEPIPVVGVARSGAGLCVGKDGWLISVPTTLVGERVTAKVYWNGPGISLAELVQVVEPSPRRITPQCKYYATCSGCSLMHLSYKDALAFKVANLKEVFSGRPKLLRLLPRPLHADPSKLGDALPIEPIVPSPMPFGFRTKLAPHYLKTPAGSEFQGIGFSERGRMKWIVDIERCEVATDAVNKEHMRVRQSMQGVRPQPRGEATVRIVHTLIPGTNAGWINSAVSVDNVVANVVNGQIFRGESNLFFQSNGSILGHLTHYVRTELKKHAVDAHGIDTLIDTYCGTGLFGIQCAGDFRRVIGIEVDRFAIAWARRNAMDNGVRNAEFYAGNVDDIFDPRLIGLSEERKHEVAVIVDPSEKGCDRAFLVQLLRLNPKVLIYVSCNPETQANDLDAIASLSEAGKMLDVKPYRIKSIRPFDMFPHTARLETVVTLVRED